jgi:hypothetical protein
VGINAILAVMDTSIAHFTEFKTEFIYDHLIELARTNVEKRNPSIHLHGYCNARDSSKSSNTYNGVFAHVLHPPPRQRSEASTETFSPVHTIKITGK